jgi:hypothetical protein
MASVFISYANEDRSAAKAAHDALEASSVNCWIAPDDIAGGANWPKAIFDAIKQSAALVLIFSTNANGSEEVDRELVIARQHKVPIVPFFIEDAAPDGAFGYLLTNLQFIQAYRMPEDEAHRALRRALETRGVVEPAPPMQPPAADVTGSQVRLPESAPFTDDDWDFVLECVDEGTAVPIIGPELMQVTVDGRNEQLYTYLAERLAEAFALPSPSTPGDPPLASAVARFIREGGEPRQVYATLKRSFPPPDRILAGEPLRQLVRISPLRLFVTTTFDPLIERALREERPGEKVTVLAHSQYSRSDDLPGVDDTDAGSTVYHLFGRLSAVPTYAITEDDMQEMLFGLQREGPTRLLHELAGRHVLFLGTNLPEWLLRSLVSLLRMRNRDRRPRAIVVADSRWRWDPSLRKYLSESSHGIQVRADGAGPFVQELYRRWNMARPVIAGATPPPGVVFLSYAPEDLEAARKLAASFEAAGLDTWLGSAAHEATVARRAIQRSSVFVPVISRRTAEADAGAYRREWSYAIDVTHTMPLRGRFIVPVVIDDQSPGSAAFPEQFRQQSWVSIDPDQVDPEFVTRVRQLVREHRLAAQL